MRFIRSFELSDWCLKVIAENLHLFINNKNIPQRHIDFLLRLYPERIYREYCSLNSISEDCMLWFLNPHNKKITLSVTTDKILQQLLVVGTNITSLSLSQSLASENILNSIICCVPHLQYLDLSYSCCTDKTLSLLQRMCPGLSTLDLHRCKEVSGQGMENLCNGDNVALKYLDLIDTGVNYNGLCTILLGMPSLEHLKYCNLADVFCFVHLYKCKNNNFENIQYNLTELIYHGTKPLCDPITVIWIWTVKCPKIKKVHFLCPVNEEILQLCTRFQHLEEIRMSNCCMRLKDVIIPILPIANNLKTLILSSVNISLDTLLENFRNLECLYLDNVHFFPWKEVDIKITETKLDTLIIRGSGNCKFTSSTTYNGIAFLLSVCKNVTRLYMKNIIVRNLDIFEIILKSMKKLNFVDFSYCQVEKNTIEHFFKIPTMRRIYLDLCSGFSFDDIHAHNYPCTLSWRIMIEDPDDGDSDVLCYE